MCQVCKKNSFVGWAAELSVKYIAKKHRYNKAKIDQTHFFFFLQSLYAYGVVCLHKLTS